MESPAFLKSVPALVLASMLASVLALCYPSEDLTVRHRKHATYSLGIWFKWENRKQEVSFYIDVKKNNKANYRNHNGGLLEGNVTLLNKEESQQRQTKRERSARLPWKARVQRHVDLRSVASCVGLLSSFRTCSNITRRHWSFIPTPILPHLHTKTSPQSFIKKYISRQMPFMSGSIPSNSSVGATDEGKRWCWGAKGKGAKTEISITAIVFAKEKRGCITKL